MATQKYQSDTDLLNQTNADSIKIGWKKRGERASL